MNETHDKIGDAVNCLKVADKIGVGFTARSVMPDFDGTTSPDAHLILVLSGEVAARLYPVIDAALKLDRAAYDAGVLAD